MTGFLRFWLRGFAIIIASAASFDPVFDKLVLWGSRAFLFFSVTYVLMVPIYAYKGMSYGELILNGFLTLLLGLGSYGFYRLVQLRRAYDFQQARISQRLADIQAKG